MPASRARAASISAFVGPVVSVAKFEDLLHDLAYGGQGVELPPLYLVEQPPQLGVVRHRVLEMRLRARRGDGKHLGGEVLAAALLEQALTLEVGTVLRDLVPQRLDVLPARRLGQHDRRPPGALLVERED